MNQRPFSISFLFQIALLVAIYSAGALVAQSWIILSWARRKIAPSEVRG